MAEPGAVREVRPSEIRRVWAAPAKTLVLSSLPSGLASGRSINRTLQTLWLSSREAKEA